MSIKVWMGKEPKALPKCPLCGAKMERGETMREMVRCSDVCAYARQWIHIDAHRAIAAKGGKALATGYFCRKGFFFQTAGPEKCSINPRCKVGCVRCEVREAEGGK